jgi:ribose-phosphate pyrophosphokinase
MGIPEVVIVSPDAGGVARARAIAKRLDVDLAIVDKRRIAPNEAEIMNVIGDVRDRDVLIVDDIVDTAGTLVNTVEALRAQGARRIFAAGIHGILSGPALDRIERSALEALLVTDTTPIDDKLEKSGKLRGLSVAPLLGEAIRRIHDNSSVTALFV